MKKFLIIISAIVLPIFALIGISILITGCGSSPNLSRMENYFQLDREKIQIIVEYLTETDFDNITIRPDRTRENGIEMFTGLETGRIPVSDEDVSGAIHTLFQRGYNIIGKNESVIYFQRWSSLDVGIGIMYSIDGTTPNESSLDFLTELEALTEDDWYFYIEDFNEWKRRQSD